MLPISSRLLFPQVGHVVPFIESDPGSRLDPLIPMLSVEKSDLLGLPEMYPVDGRLAPYRLIPPSLQLILRRGENLLPVAQEQTELLEADTCASSAPVASVEPQGSLESNKDICGPDAAAAVTTFFLRSS